MKIKEKLWETCVCCGSKTNLLEEEIFGCDHCRIEIGEHNLRVMVHSKDFDSTDHQLCSWQCVFAFLQTIQCDWFISLPFVSADVSAAGQTIADFWQAVKDFK